MNRRTVLFVLAFLGFSSFAPPLHADPLQVTISGTSMVILWGTSTRYASWSASVTGGTPPYSYQWIWNGHAVSGATGSSFGGTYQGPGQDKTWTDVVSVVVTDIKGETASDSHNISGTAHKDNPFSRPLN